MAKRKKSKKNYEIIEPEIISESKGLSSQDSPSSSGSMTLYDPVQKYMAEIKKYKLLTREEERKWAIKYYETGDPTAAEILVTSNLRFVVKIAAEYAKFGSKLIDLIQEGNVGLMHAVKEYNPYKDVKLITYAVWWIRGYIQDYLMKQYSMVKIGTTQNQRKLFYRLQKEKDNIDQNGYQSVVKQLSGQLGIPEDEVEQMSQRMSSKDVSLNAPLGEVDGHSLLDLQFNEDDTPIDERLAFLQDLKNLTDVILELREDLNERELVLLDHRILADEPLTLQEIGEKNQVTREAVRQMEVRLIQKIKKKMEDTQKLKDLN